MCTFTTESLFSSQGPQVLLHGLPCCQNGRCQLCFCGGAATPVLGLDRSGLVRILGQAPGLREARPPLLSLSLCPIYTLHPPANSLPSGYSSALPSAERPGTPFW